MSIGSVVGRLAALVVAILLVVGALLFRDRGSATVVPDDGTPTATVAGTVRCATELGICDRLAEALGDDVTVVAEDGVVTARSLQEATSADPWVTTMSLLEVVDDGRERASREPLFVGGPYPVGTSPLVLVGWTDRMATLEDACGATWACIGQVAGGTWADVGGASAWGSPKPAHDAPDTSGVGLLVLGQAAASQLDGAAVTPRNLDTPAFQSWFTTLERAVPSFQPSSGSQLVEMVQFGPSSRDVVGTTEAEAAEVLTRAGARGADLRVVHATPPVTAVAVVAAPGKPPPGLLDAASTALVEVGWRVDGATPDVTLPTPLPSAPPQEPILGDGALEALLVRWEQVR